MRTSNGMLPLTVIEFPVCRAFGLAADPKQGPEGVERVEAPIKAERERKVGFLKAEYHRIKV